MYNLYILDKKMHNSPPPSKFMLLLKLWRMFCLYQMTKTLSKHILSTKEYLQLFLNYKGCRQIKKKNLKHSIFQVYTCGFKQCKLKDLSLFSLCLSWICLLAKSLQSCPTLCNPIDGSPPGSAIPGILQARILEWVAIYFSNA